MKLLLLVLSLLVLSITAQVPIPTRPDGYALNTAPASSPVVLDAFFDLLCPDSQAAWPTIKQLLAHYPNNLYFLLHTFPLPYHTNSFIANQGLHVIDHYTQHNRTALLQYTDLLFSSHQSDYSNAATLNQTIHSVIQSLAQLQATAGIIPAKSFLAGIANGDINEETRVSWKYTCSRSVVGTPTFLLNGVFISADASWSLSDWQSVIDPLIKAQDRDERINRHVREGLRWAEVQANSTCPSGETVCNYSPHESQCCLAGENCIPNVGCRCLKGAC
jgi:2-hydroxychromene-2-carboxylate isomerase